MTAAYRHVRRHFDAIMGGDIEPIVKANFLTSTSLPSWLTFSRTGHATMFDSTGKLTWAPNNLITKGTTLASPWINDGITVTTGVSDPDGGTNACTLAATKTNAERYIPVAEDGAANYYAINGCYMRKRSGTGNIKFYNPLGTVANSYTLTDSWQWLESPKSLGNASIGAAGGFYFFFHIDTSGDEIDIYMPVICKVTHQTTIPTASKQLTVNSQYYGPRFDYDPATLAARGLLIEESRTNYCINSYTVGHTGWSSASAGGPVVPSVVNTNSLAPDGSSTAVKLSFPTAGAGTVSKIYAPATYSGAHTISLYLKGDVGGEVIYLIGYNGSAYFYSTCTLTTSWQRFSASTASGVGTVYVQLGQETSAGTGGISACTIYAWGAQLENGSFPTSYIPNLNTAGGVLRNAETVSATGLAIPSTNCAGVLEFEALAPSVQSDIYSFGTGAIANGYFMYGSSAGAIITQRAASSSVRTITPTPGPGSPIFRYAFSRKGADLMLGVNNGTVVPNSSVVADPATPLTTVKILGTHNFYGTPTSGWARFASVYYAGLSSAQVEAASALSGQTTGFLLENGTDFLLLESGDYLLQE